MSPLTNIAAVVAVTVAATCSYARPEINQMAPLPAPIPSQERTLGTDSRAADDFVLPAGNGRPHHVRIIQVAMFGNGVPNAAKFGVTLFRNAGIFTTGVFGPDRPGRPLATRLGATTVIRMNTLGTSAMYLETFAVPAGEIVVAPGTRLWISGFGRLDDTRFWGFCRTSRPASNGTLGLFSSPFQPDPIFGQASWTPVGNYAFRVITTQP